MPAIAYYRAQELNSSEDMKYTVYGKTYSILSLFYPKVSFAHSFIMGE